MVALELVFGGGQNLWFGLVSPHYCGTFFHLSSSGRVPGLLFRVMRTWSHWRLSSPRGESDHTRVRVWFLSSPWAPYFGKVNLSYFSSSLLVSVSHNITGALSYHTTWVLLSFHSRYEPSDIVNKLYISSKIQESCWQFMWLMTPLIKGMNSHLKTQRSSLS